MDYSKNFQFGKFQKLSIWKIPKISNYENFKKFQLGQFQNCPFLQWNFVFPNWKNSENSLIFQFGKIPNIYQILKFRTSNFHYWQIHKIAKVFIIVQFRKLENFQNLTILKAIKIPKIFNLVIYHVCILSFETIKTNVKIRNEF